MSAACDASDDQFGPRVATNCRGFDFTLLFEDAVLTVIPAALFALFLIARLYFIRRDPVKVVSYRLAAYKLTLLTALFVLLVVYAVLRIRTPVLRTPSSLASDILNIIVTAGAVVLSFLEDQRSARPSDLLVIYFSALALLGIPKLRSLWMISSSGPCRGLWTAIYTITVLVAFLESTRKVRILRPLYKHVTAEQISGFWSRSVFAWVVPFVQAGYSKILSVGDMPEADENLQGDLTREKLDHAWVRSEGKHRLIKAVFRAYLWPTLSAIVPRLVLSGFTFCQPFLITATVDYFTGDAKDKPKEYGQALVGAFLLVYMGIAISTAVYWRQTFRLGTMVRAGLMSSLYSKTVFLAAEDVKGSAVLTLMGTDVERIVNSFRSLHEMWASIIEVGVALYLLERQVYLACLVPAIISLACVFGTGPISSRTAPAQKAWVERVEERVSVTSSMLKDMKSVKMLGLTEVFLGLITKLRVAELKTSSQFRKLLIWMVLISNIPLTFAPYATFAIYSIISLARNDQSLVASQAFTSLSLISLLTSPLLGFVQAAPSFIQCIGCFERIQVYLEKTPIPDSSRNEKLATEYADKPPTIPSVVSFKDVDIMWSSDSEAVFQSLTLDIGKGITMITGPVGSGKSALVKSILGEMKVRKGSVDTAFSNVAYCSQTPWVVDDTIRHNITGGTEFDEIWYDFAVSASCLKDDFQSIPAGDMHIAGSSGASLSGGQKQRLALARAIYSRFPVLLLDDIFSGLDSKRISDISANLFAEHGYFRTSGKTVILVTHTDRLLPFADNIIVLEQGAAVYKGSYKDFIDRTPGAMLKDLTLTQEVQIDSDTDKTPVEESQCDAAGSSPIDISENEDEDDFSRRDGSWEVYTYYTKSAGPWITATFIGSFMISNFLSTFSTLWIQWWSDSNSKDPNGKIGWYLGFYTAFTVIGTLLFFIGCILLFINIINDTALTLHTDLLKATLKAPWSFFQTTNVGTMTNRFSQDMDLIDMKLPIWLINTVANVSSAVMNLILLCVIGKYMAVTFPFLIATFVVIQRVYLRTSRQVRLLDIEAKAPLYAHFVETIDGITSMRAFGWRGSFQVECTKRINQSQRPFYMLLCLQQWLSLVLDLVIAAMAVVLMGIATSLRDQFSAGGMGVALNLVLNLNQILVLAIQSWTQLETSIGAVTRVHSFQKDTPGEDGVLEPALSAQEWPTEGAVAFEDLTVAYHADSQPVLKNLTLTIKPGEKIALCGPSGSGKSSLIMTLLQMTEVKGGYVLIDGQDLTSVPPSDTRLRLNVIPQDPYFVPGTIRLNLDPHAAASDDEIVHAVKRVGLWEQIQTKGGLDGDLDASKWSMGEKQLLALARALSSRSPILILDEATSNVDRETESIMQEVIETEFTKQTVIMVMHRLRYITRFDRVALMKKGELVECDSPSALLARESEFKEFYTA
ncbi:hypothetical protein ASPZODRAFT_64884 [Penicilliopsis zonata CBS 506.65]|uniref:ABC transporter n=1 Tax=Penicilliopsis zonata CBS 506.65 TaxID=1073090 RepID=A0A1L9SJG7_9EURO|nr:hypothetical protein ASPZODRAFT_64884 [Penicilliopsis zonata CBS 506.65]OJJ47369.1 hypothetical protein ASPZODRAFT_64884 [Penicilliopsis zonata CBS 506.65]